ncbi:DUF4430 domain-containing protein, partial [Oscillospiraceae bacterium OttesenSCG-928-G22]|nr:DUF4430 domain-containing protein [Oscillospiraceae bacterium OttesenSCG-928-G22]
MLKRYKSELILVVVVLVLLVAALLITGFASGGGASPPARTGSPASGASPSGAAPSDSAPSPSDPSPSASFGESATPEPSPSASPGDPSPSPSTRPSGTPRPSGAPVVASPSAPPNDTAADGGAFTCTLSVRCDTILNNTDALNPDKADLVPADGAIFAAATVTFYEGESVFHVLQREMKQAKIHMEFVNTPIYSSAYIEGIANLYEFDCGELSGWMYKVNGEFPSTGCSRHTLSEG